MEEKGSGFQSNKKREEESRSVYCAQAHTFSLIAALDRNRLIGKGEGLPWRLPADLKRFKAITMGKPIVMGRKTHESIGRPLPGRLNIVLTRRRDYRVKGCTIAHSISEVKEAVPGGGEIIVIGGAQVYELFLPLVRRMFLTMIDSEFLGDVSFPAFEIGEWQEVSREYHGLNEGVPFSYSFVILERKIGASESSSGI
jgi:dihydrofolate reductase